MNKTINLKALNTKVLAIDLDTNKVKTLYDKTERHLKLEAHKGTLYIL